MQCFALLGKRKRIQPGKSFAHVAVDGRRTRRRGSRHEQQVAGKASTEHRRMLTSTLDVAEHGGDRNKSKAAVANYLRLKRG